MSAASFELMSVLAEGGSSAAEAVVPASFLYAAVGLAIVMLIWDTVEVGRNDAANIVNAVFGARILRRQSAVWLAGIGVIFGAGLSSGVMETARKGIFDPTAFTIQQALAIYISVYIVDTVLLYGYSAFGMPVSTTMCLVFELLGAAFFMGLFFADQTAVLWGKAGNVLLGVVCSILLTGALAFMIQRAARGAIGARSDDLATLRLHGGWIGGGLLAGLCYFMIVKGMKQVSLVKSLKTSLLDSNPYIAPILLILILWFLFALLIHIALAVFREPAARALFPTLTLIGMVSMGFAFGQNDLANCASPGLAAIELFKGHQKGHDIEQITAASLPTWALFGSGFLLLLGMSTENAQRVTRAEVNTGSAGDTVRLYAPQWCIVLAKYLLKFRSPEPALAPTPQRTPQGKTQHYDALRAAIIVSISASTIATASALKLPVSTTYVAFAAVLATGAADRIFVRGDSALKLGRFIWVVFSWFLSGVIAAVATGLTCIVVYKGGIVGMVACLLTNLTVRHILARRSDAQEARIKREAEERRHPEEFALEDE